MSFSVNYAALTQMMQDWPVNAGANYLSNMPNYVNLGELRVLTDLNLDIFDAVDQSQELTVGETLVTKPSGLVQLRSMRIALITGTASLAANPISLVVADTATTVDPTGIPLTGGGDPPPSSISFSPAAQVSVTQNAGGSGVFVVITGLDQNGDAVSETIDTLGASMTVLTTNRFSVVTGVASYDGSSGQTISVGNAAVTENTLGQSYPIFKRSKAFLDAYNADPAVVGRPRYFAELSTTQWQTAVAADQSYQVVVHFIERPESIVLAGTTWIGNNAGELLFLASLMEAERYLKADDRFADIAGDYNTKLATRRTELRESIRVGDYSPMKPAAVPAQ